MAEVVERLSTPIDPTPLLQVKSVAKEFPAAGRKQIGSPVVAVADVSFDIPSGGALALVGESGCGKTTTARIIVGLEAATRGTISWRGQPLARPSRAADRRGRAKLMQMVFQNPYASLSPTRTVRETLVEVVAFHTARRGMEIEERVTELAGKVGLSEEELARRPRKLSGGQCQRAAIARSLAADPELLVLDEAVSALDVSTQAQILNLIDQLRSDLRIAILLITHDLAIVRQVCDDIVVMESGRVVEFGRVHSVLSRPSEPYTQRLLNAVPRGRV